MLELLIMLGFQSNEADQTDSEPPGPNDGDGDRPAHPRLDRPSDELLLAEVWPSHAPEYC